MGTKFVDPCNPTAEELRIWAGSREQFPLQDWDIIIAADDAKMLLFLELAADEQCLKHGTFLRILYLVVGDAVRSGWRAHDRARIEALISSGAAHSRPAIKLWASRAQALIEAPETFSYAAWCDGGLARNG